MAPVSASFFRVVGRQPAIGRHFEPADEQGPKPLVAVISHSLWTRRFGRDTRCDRPGRCHSPQDRARRASS